MPEIMLFSELVESNGKTVRENNLAREHKIPIGTLVEVRYDEWFGNGACEKVHARLWVVEHARDCDGTPLYTLAARTDPEWVRVWQTGSLTQRMTADAILHIKTGLGEESLTPIEITEAVERGEGALSWDDDEWSAVDRGGDHG